MRLLAVIFFLVAALPQPLAAQVYEAAVAANKRGDYLTAIKYLRPLAEKGVPEAQALLGAMYAQGRGVPPDPAKAIKWFRKGIEQGNHWAQHNLGFMYAQGHGVPKNYFEAAKWFRRAANQGNADAQSNLGAMYSVGRGVPQDFVQAYIWLSVAVDNGAKFALANLKNVMGQLTKKELKNANVISKLCLKKTASCPEYSDD